MAPATRRTALLGLLALGLLAALAPSRSAAADSDSSTASDGGGGATEDMAPIPPPSGPPASPNTTFSKPPGPPSGWIRARASWYGTPHPFVDVFAPSRGGGEAAFGILEWGGCGYTNGNGDLAWPKDAVASYADANPDFPGSCGRCYEIQCVDGIVLGKDDEAVPYGNWYYYPEHGSAVDDFNRSFPGNPAEKDGYVYVRCWDPSSTVRVHINDICPCWYSPKDQEPYEQPSCCYKNSTNPRSGQWEMDLSFWVYEKLAHPMYPEMMLNIRPVDCNTGAALPLEPGYINSDTLYDDMVTPGWSWFAYDETPKNMFNVTAPGWGLSGSAAACAQLQPNGGMTWWCRDCYKPGYQPFASATSVSFWIRDRYNPGNTPPLKVMVAMLENSSYCPGEAYLTSLSPSDRGGDGWLQFTLPFDSTFNCGDLKSILDYIAFMNVGSGNSWFCVDEFKVSHATSPPSEGTAAPAPSKKRLRWA